MLRLVFDTVRAPGRKQNSTALSSGMRTVHSQTLPPTTESSRFRSAFPLRITCFTRSLPPILRDDRVRSIKPDPCGIPALVTRSQVYPRTRSESVSTCIDGKLFALRPSFSSQTQRHRKHAVSLRHAL